MEKDVSGQENHTVIRKLYVCSAFEKDSENYGTCEQQKHISYQRQADQNHKVENLAKHAKYETIFSMFQEITEKF